MPIEGTEKRLAIKVGSIHISSRTSHVCVECGFVINEGLGLCCHQCPEDNKDLNERLPNLVVVRVWKVEETLTSVQSLEEVNKARIGPNQGVKDENSPKELASK